MRSGDNLQKIRKKIIGDISGRILFVFTKFENLPKNIVFSLDKQTILM